MRPTGYYDHPDNFYQRGFSTRNSAATYNVANRQHNSLSRASPPTTQQPSGGTRKRISVACGRCRKRKIKCSGDENGKGCSNCIGANVRAGECAFLRAGASEIMEYPTSTSPAQLYTNYDYYGSAPPISYNSTPPPPPPYTVRSIHSQNSLHTGYNGASNFLHSNGGNASSTDVSTSSLELGIEDSSNMFPSYMLPSVSSGGSLPNAVPKEWVPITPGRDTQSSLYLSHDQVGLNGTNFSHTFSRGSDKVVLPSMGTHSARLHDGSYMNSFRSSSTWTTEAGTTPPNYSLAVPKLSSSGSVSIYSPLMSNEPRDGVLVQPATLYSQLPSSRSIIDYSAYTTAPSSYSISGTAYPIAPSLSSQTISSSSGYSHKSGSRQDSGNGDTFTSHASVSVAAKSLPSTTYSGQPLTPTNDQDDNSDSEFVIIEDNNQLHREPEPPLSPLSPSSPSTGLDNTGDVIPGCLQKHWDRCYS